MKLSRTMLAIPERVIVAVSGGPDSMALLEFCRLGKKAVVALNIHHGTYFSSRAYQLVKSYCASSGIEFDSVGISQPCSSAANLETYWHDERARAYVKASEFYGGAPVLTGHTLDDAIEWWLLTSFKGSSKLMPYEGAHNTLRPMLLTDRSEVREFADRHKVPYLDDPTNIGFSNDRARLRTLPLEQLFPYIRGTIRNKYLGASGLVTLPAPAQ